MKTLTNFTYTGNKQKIGGLIFDESDRLLVFVNYCPECRAKVCFTRAEAEEFAKRYQERKNKIRTKLVIKLVRQ